MNLTELGTIVLTCPSCNHGCNLKDAVQAESYEDGYGCDTCGYGGTRTTTVRLICPNCLKVAFEQEETEKTG